MENVKQASFRRIDQTVFESPEFRRMADRERLVYLDGLVYGFGGGLAARARRYFRCGEQFEVGAVVGLLIGLTVGAAVTAACVVRWTS